MKIFNKHKIIPFFLCILFVFSATACNGLPLRSEDTIPLEDREEIHAHQAQLTQQDIRAFDPTFTDGINQFGFEALSLLYDDENISISPASLQLALLMTAAGATDETRDEMMRTLRMDTLSDSEIYGAVRQLMWRTNIHGMENANSLWLQEDYPFSDDYLNIVSDSFMADLFQTNFISHPDAATQAINQWGSQKTHGRIPEILSSELSTDTRLVLVNALYYLGEWVYAFDPSDTYDDTFYGTESDSNVPFMHNTRDMDYTQNEYFQALSLPFQDDDGNTGPYAMAILLPNEDSTVSETLEYLSTQQARDVFSAMQNTRVRLSLPKFEFEYGLSMTEPLNDLGINRAFSDIAQFDLMTGSDNDLYVSDVVHKTYIRVDEEGAEAAAVTAVEMEITMMPIEEESVEFNANRPFVFAIYDTTDNTVIFVGVTSQL